MRSKIDVIRHTVIEQNPELFFISESNIKLNDEVSVINVYGYSLFQSMEINGSSRLACYCREGSGFEVIYIPDDEVQLIGLENKSMRVYGIYRPFTNCNGLTLSANLDKLVQVLHGLPIGDKPTFIGGDFNIEANKNGDPALLRMELWMIECGLTQYIKDITRRRTVTLQNGTRRVEESCLDHIYGDCSGLDCDFGTLNIPGSDHLAVRLTWQEMKTPTKKTVTLDWRNYNLGKISFVMENDETALEIVEDLRTINDVDDLNRKITELHLHLLNKICPPRVVRLRRVGQAVDNQIEKLKKR